MKSNKIFTSGWDDYELIDAGGGKKLERWGNVITIRPELQAYFRSGLPFSDWKKQADFEFIQGKGQTGKWVSYTNKNPNWIVNYKKLKFELELTKFKHVGLFPEQRLNWDLIMDSLDSEKRFLNLFAYTGAASCAARFKGAETYHVDSVKQLITWASKNMEHSRLMNIRWVHEDALKFARRLVKREEKFDFIIMDPPAWGIGAKKEKWKLEDKLDELLSSANELLAENGTLVLNTYSPQVELKLIKELSELYFQGRSIELGELWMKTTTGKEMYYGNLLRVRNSSYDAS